MDHPLSGGREVGTHLLERGEPVEVCERLAPRGVLEGGTQRACPPFAIGDARMNLLVGVADSAAASNAFRNVPVIMITLVS